MPAIDREVQHVLEEFEWDQSRLAAEVVRLRARLKQAELDVNAPAAAAVAVPKPAPPDPPDPRRPQANRSD